MQNPQNLRIALLTVTLLPFAVIAWATSRQCKALLVSVLFLECILLVNVGWHVFCRLGGYAPGVITAVLIDLPFGVYVLRKAVKEQWIQRRRHGY